MSEDEAIRDDDGDDALSWSIRAAVASDHMALNSIDDEAAQLFGAHGVHIDLPPAHPFLRDESARWLRSAELERAFVAVDPRGAALGFAALDVVDGEPYLDQLSVRPSAMRRGIGRSLLARSIAWAQGFGASRLWLTTYAHLPFNRPYYERHGFVVVPEAQCGPGLRHHLDEQRRALPAPEQRVAMRRTLDALR